MTIEKKSSRTLKSKDGYLFHPYEVGFCGFSNSGKTTLISKLLNEMKSDRQVGYIKHDVHRFEMDREGKDTAIAWASGASRVLISDPRHTATIAQGTPDWVEMKSSFLSCDLVFLEGYKNSIARKIVVVDSERKILDQVESGEISHVIAFVGQGQDEGILPLEVPYFQRDDVSGIVNFLKQELDQRVKTLPLFGLVLAGGKSSRMKTDKAVLDYHGKPQAEIVHDLLSSRCDSTFISSRLDRSPRSELSHLDHIFDQFGETGPLGGILSAMQAHPKAAWLVAACDLPFLNEETLDRLILNRDPFQMGTCFKSTRVDLPEPLCAIYEPKMFLRLLSFMGLGYQCPRKILIHSRVKILDQKSVGALDNINTVEELQGARERLEIGTVR